MTTGEALDTFVCEASPSRRIVRPMRALLALSCACLCAAGCLELPPPLPRDGGVTADAAREDTRVDATDAWSDADTGEALDSGDATPDAASDADIDAGVDIDAGADTGADAGDGGLDTGVPDTGPSCSDDDGDGYLPTGCGPGLPADCRTRTASIHPGALELCGNGVDEDCSGLDLPCVDAIPGLRVQSSGASVDITSRVAAMSFGSAAAGHPTSLVLPDASTDNVLYTRTDKPERRAGVVFYVSEAEVYSSDTSTRAATLTLLEQGPALVRYQLAWEGSDARRLRTALRGTTTYTFHADGRIHRHEDVALTRTRRGNFSVFIGLRRALFTQAAWDVSRTAGSAALDFDFVTFPYNFPYEGTSADRGYVCVYSPAGRHTLVWSHAESGVVVPYGLRITESTTTAPGSESVALNSDWLRSATVDARPGRYVADVLLFPSTTGALAQPCAVGAAAAQAFVLPPSMTPTIGSIDTLRPGDRGADGYDESVGAYALRTAGGAALSVSWAGLLPPSVTLTIDGVTSTRDPTVHRGAQRLEHGRDYLYQSAPGARAWLVLYPSPALGQALRVDWP